MGVFIEKTSFVISCRWFCTCCLWQVDFAAKRTELIIPKWLHPKSLPQENYLFFEFYHFCRSRVVIWNVTLCISNVFLGLSANFRSVEGHFGMNHNYSDKHSGVNTFK